MPGAATERERPSGLTASEVEDYVLSSRDAVHFATRNCWIRDDDGRDVRFEARRYQTEKILRECERALSEGRGRLWEKSRRMGLTWNWAIFFLHALLFRDGIAAGYLSDKADKVDDGGSGSTPYSFFGKLRFVHARLPAHLRHPVRWKLRHAECPDRGSSVIGETANPDAFRGGGLAFIGWDEMAHTEHDQAIWASVSKATRVVLGASSPRGRVNVFAVLRHTVPAPLPVIRLHWSEHFDKAWYEAERLRIGIPEVIASELDVSYEASLTGRIYPEFSRDVHLAPISFNPKLEQLAGWDYGISDPTAVVWAQVTADDELQVYDYLEGQDKIADWYAGEVHRRDGVLGRKRVAHHGDPSGSQRNSQGTSWVDDLAARGIPVESRPQTVTEGIALLRRRVIKGRGKGGIVFSPSCERLIEAISSYRWKPNTPERDEPLHDWASHGCDALRYLVVGRFGAALSKWSIVRR